MPACWNRNSPLTKRLLLALCVCWVGGLHGQLAAQPIAAARAEMPATSSVTAPATSTTEVTELLLTVAVNGEAISEPALVLQHQAGQLLFSTEDLKRWRLRLPLPLPTQALYRHGDDEYMSLDGQQDLNYTFNPRQQAVQLMANPRILQASAFELRALPTAPPSTPQPGGFFNYELLGAHGADGFQRAGQFEFGWFNAWGVGTLGVVAPEASQHTQLVRLDATWSADQPGERQSWRLGDVINRAGSWGRSVRLGGVQWATNFGVQPGFISNPLQQAAGVAALPSTVDVYVNNALTTRREVPAGPFSVNNLPAVTGSGEVRLVVRDLLGREQVLTHPFYASAGLLAPGLQDFSYELGFVRQNFGVQSNDYGHWLAVLTHRRGLTEHFTGELHAELQPDLKAAGLSALYLVPAVGVFNAALAGSQSRDAKGSLLALGVERLAAPFNVGVRSQWTQQGFRLTGDDTRSSLPRQQWSANLGYTTQQAGSLGLSWLQQTAQDNSRIEIAAANYAMSLGNRGNLMLSLARTQGTSANTQMALTWTLPLGPERPGQSVSLSHNRSRYAAQENSAQSVATYQKNVPVAEGFGYQLEARDSGDARGALGYQNRFGSYQLEAAHANGEQAGRASVRGGLAYAGQQVYASRWISDSFGLARVPGFPGVRVYADNQWVGTTDANGNALLPRLRAYQRNPVRLEPRDLPLNAQVDTLMLEVVPFYRSAALADFPVRLANGAQFQVLLASGEPLPAGSTVQLMGAKQPFPVGFDGVVYVTGLSAHNTLQARWQTQSCTFELAFAASADALPDLGSVLCTGVTP